MGDPTLDWLLANDPQAKGRSRREYGHAAGIITPQREGDIHSRELSLDEMPSLADAAYHCASCRRRAEVSRRGAD